MSLTGHDSELFSLGATTISHEVYCFGSKTDGQAGGI